MNSCSVNTLSPFVSISLKFFTAAKRTHSSGVAGGVDLGNSSCARRAAMLGARRPSASKFRLATIIMAARSSSLGSTPVSHIIRPESSTGSLASTVTAACTCLRTMSSGGT
eukprot:scaffold37873_cov27-Tisochrysis_lutea.AAC.5